jgi:hypothetical protein
MVTGYNPAAVVSRASRGRVSGLRTLSDIYRTVNGQAVHLFTGREAAQVAQLHLEPVRYTLRPCAFRKLQARARQCDLVTLTKDPSAADGYAWSFSYMDGS